MNTLYVIGNGFDKAHGICTDYWDFRTFLETYYSDFCKNLKECMESCQLIIQTHIIPQMLKKSGI